MKYTEKEFQLEITKLIKSKGYNETIINNECKNEALNKKTLTNFLSLKYKIGDDEINEIINEIYRKIDRSSWYKNNKTAFLDFLRNGIQTKYTRKNNLSSYHLVDFNDINDNIFEIAQEVYINESSRVDIVLFVNGLPIYIFELKSAFRDEATLRDAFQQVKGYLTDENQLFATFNIAQIVAKNFNYSKIGSIGSNTLDTWFDIISEDGVTQDFVNFFSKKSVIEYLKWGVLFGKSNNKKEKFILKKHQHQAIKNILKSLLINKGGYVWHTQGAGKTITMSALIIAMMRTNGLSNFTSIIDVDRTDLVDNVIDTFKKIDPIHFDDQFINKAKSRNELKEYLSTRKYRGVIVTTTQKFEDWGEVSSRDDLLIISDEAHRSHKESSVAINDKTYLEKMQVALPNAIKIGFTGTPIFETDISTFAMFGECIHKYTMKQAEIDKVIVPINCSFYKIPLEIKREALEFSGKYGKIIENKRIWSESNARLEYITDVIADKFKHSKMHHKSLDVKTQHITEDKFKAMVVTDSKIEGFKIYKLLLQKIFKGDDKKIKFVASFSNQDEKERKNSEVNAYLNSTKNDKQVNILKFKEADSEIEVMVVVDMLITGYDVPNLRMLFLDKNVKMHNLLQTIARVNRKYPQKEYGTVISFRDLEEEMREALIAYTSTTNDHETIIKLSQNSEKEIEKICHKVLTEFKIDLISESENLVGYNANIIKDRWGEDKKFMTLINEIILVSSAIIKWENKMNARVAMLCKIIVQSKRFEKPTYIDISDEDFNKLLELTEVKKEFIKVIEYTSLSEIIHSNINDESMLNAFSIKMKAIINKDQSLTKEEKLSLLEQLKKIIENYNGKNKIEIIDEIITFEKSINKGKDLSILTKILIQTVKEVAKKDLADTTKFIINDYFEKMGAAFDIKQLTVGEQKNVKFKINEILRENEPDLAHMLRKIITSSWDTMMNKY